MQVTYDIITLEISKTVGWDQEAVYTPDGADFLYEHIRFRVVAIWNPRATANNNEDLPAASIATLRHTLLQPRKELLMEDQLGNVLLHTGPGSRVNGFRVATDARNGPQPNGLRILEVIGDKSAIVEWECECWVNECATRFRPLLSHRWETESEVDEDAYTTRTITGEAHFRSDALLAANTVPDDYRRWLAQPIPLNFIRRGIRVASSSDGLTLRYTYQDVQKRRSWAVNPNGRDDLTGIADFDGTYSVGYDYTPNWLPIRFEQLDMEVRGRPGMTRNTIINPLLTQCAEINFRGDFGARIDARPRMNIGLTLTVSMVRKYARLQAKWMTSGATGSIRAIFGSSIREKINEALANTTILFDQPTDGSGPLCRGYLTGRAVAQALAEECTRPAQTAFEGSAFNVTNPG